MHSAKNTVEAQIYSFNVHRGTVEKTWPSSSLYNWHADYSVNSAVSIFKAFLRALDDEIQEQCYHAKSDETIKKKKKYH